MPQLDKISWESSAIEVDPSEFLEALLYADESDDRVNFRQFFYLLKVI